MVEVKLDGRELMESLTLRLSMPRAFGARMRIVGFLIRLAGAISPVRVEAKLIDADES